MPGDVKLAKIHSIFQAAMGWDDYHLHRFEIGEHAYTADDGEMEDDEIDEESVHLTQVIVQPMRFTYLYDFGDHWQHEVVIESIQAVPTALKFAVCLDGQRATPPEDCGGVGGFAEFLQAVSDPNHPDHEQHIRWFGRPFDPEEFSVAEVNARLQRAR